MPQIRRTRAADPRTSPGRSPRRGMRQATAARSTGDVGGRGAHVRVQPLRVSRSSVLAGPRKTRRRRWAAATIYAWATARAGFGQRPSWLISLAIHAVLLTTLALWTLTAVREEPPELLATVAPEPMELKNELPPVDVAMPEPELADDVEMPSAEEPLDTLMVEAPSVEPRRYVERDPLLQAGFDPLMEVETAGRQPASGRTNAAPAERVKGKASFFGAAAQADRIIYLVDNSNSMVDGRFETALGELARSINALTAKQSFYVIFYSDAAYRLFHPNPAPGLIAATPQNKRRVRRWLGTVQTCTGGRVIDALQLAASLQPQIIYLLSDGMMSDYPYRYLTDNQGRKYVLHTIGMTVPNDEAAHKLAAIARHNRGTFRAVGIAGPARVLARRRPIKKNRHRGTVWGINLPER